MVGGLGNGRTGLQVDGVDPDLGVPAAVFAACPVRGYRAALGEQYDHRQQSRDDQQGDQGPEAVSQRLRVLDPQHEQADGDFEAAQDGEEEELGEPGQEVDVLVVGRVDELGVSAVAVLDADELACDAPY